MKFGWVILCVVGAACGGGSKAVDDMTVPSDLSIGPDLSSPGFVGDPCTSTAQCTEGQAPVCWTATLQNMTGNLAVAGGYCSSSCTTNADCGDALCVSFSSGSLACVSRCTAPTDCRTGYACFLAGGGNCFPSGGLTCDPTAGTGTCPGNTPEPGECHRYAFGTGNTGECLDGCRPGVGTCSTLNGVARQCTVHDNAKSQYGDKFVGPVCIDAYSKNAIGSECLSNGFDYIDACVDNAACYLSVLTAGGDNKCHQLCIPGASSDPCTTGTCTDVWGTFSSSNPAGLCL